VRIVFFGTPEFAVPSLRALLGEGFDIAAVVTQPDQPLGRSRSRTVPPPVKAAALEEALAILQPGKPTDPDFLRSLHQVEPELGVVVAYGHILKADLLAVPRRGMINVHASLLPRFRGAAPIQHALMAGETETGISIIQLDEGMDTGPVLHRVATPVAPDETGGELTARLSELGALALVAAVSLLANGEARPEPQDHARATYAPKLTRELARIRWEAPADRVARLARALDPRPGAWTTLGGKDVKLFAPRAGAGTGEPGTVIAASPLAVATGTGVLVFNEVQPAGKDRMLADQWARGRGVSAGQRFE